MWTTMALWKSVIATKSHKVRRDSTGFSCTVCHRRATAQLLNASMCPGSQTKPSRTAPIPAPVPPPRVPAQEKRGRKKGTKSNPTPDSASAHTITYDGHWISCSVCGRHQFKNWTRFKTSKCLGAPQASGPEEAFRHRIGAVANGKFVCFRCSRATTAANRNKFLRGLCHPKAHSKGLAAAQTKRERAASAPALATASRGKRRVALAKRSSSATATLPRRRG
ncbi:unnamed protein product [Polarella glacialis]|uniref:Uncharacterized protein n=1 Tax=Polarella glacialis TaxID=89957 RepID=A0A813EE75_POLGL|nr:unnamed protein product [Polarella glacialis]